jgi:hypothetical protein
MESVRTMFARLYWWAFISKDADIVRLCLALYLIHRIHLKIGEEENKGKLMHKLSCVGAQGGLAALVLDLVGAGLAPLSVLRTTPVDDAPPISAGVRAGRVGRSFCFDQDLG